MGLFDNVSWSNPNILGGGFNNFANALSTGKDTPWGAGGQKGLSGLNPFGGFTEKLIPGLDNFVSSAGKGLFGEQPDKPIFEDAKSFNANDYAASDYGDYNRGQQEQIARNLSRNQNSVIAGNQKSGVLNSGSTGYGLADALGNASGQRQGLAGQIGQLQYGDKLGQYNNYLAGVNGRNQATAGKYGDDMNIFNQNQKALGQAASIAATAALL